MTSFSRRELLAVLSAMGLTPAAFVLSRDSEAAAMAAEVFSHGVASGDPLQDRVILWTKLTPGSFGKSVVGRWYVASDPRLAKVIRSGEFTTDVTRDFTVKIDVAGLDPGRTYYYQFEALGARSSIGRTKTLPVGNISSLRFAFASCANYPQGYFNAYARIAERHDLDFVLHLGDYIYEYDLQHYVNPALVGIRDVQPINEIVTLTDYRLRHALYKSDRDLQAVHQQHPFICVWDDHEFANDAYRDGAENHNPENGEGDWATRKRNAIRAYQEYMPIRGRSLQDAKIYRQFKFGNLADLIMLDTRIHGRDKQFAPASPDTPIAADDPVIVDPKRSLLGFDQERWLAKQLTDSKQRSTPWRLLGQQVMMAQLSITKGTTLRNADQWDGYSAARARLFQQLVVQRIDNTVVMSGDIHSSWCNDLASKPWDLNTYDPVTGKGALAVEFIAPAVSSPGPVSNPEDAVNRAKQIPAISPHIKYLDFVQRGYGLLDVTAERVQGEIYHVPTVNSRVNGERLAAAFVSESHRNGLQKVSSATPARSAADPAPQS
jgi:alkaline phosphatase D